MDDLTQWTNFNFDEQEEHCLVQARLAVKYFKNAMKNRNLNRFAEAFRELDV